MESLSQLYLPGAVPVWAAVVFALAALWGYSLVLRGDQAAVGFARRAYGFFTLSIVLSAAVLAIALVRRDFRVEYVFQYTGLELPMHYQFAAFWAGQKGSFLLWLLFGALIGLLVRRTAGKAEAAVMGIYTLTLVGLLFILVRENPFVMLAETPLDGQGLNPLLQDDWMVIHPPIMFVGYALAAVPYAFAMAALWRRDYSGWAARAFPWALTGFLVLGSAILLGGYWAYKTLGWGGYWGWDPVENASLIPWILGVVLIHGLYLERTKGRYRRANFVLAGLVYMAVLYGTFLTRSGVLADFSVHSFVDLGISGWLILMMAVFLALPVALIALRWREIPAARNEDPVLSRGAFLVIGTVTLTASALVITAGTSAPLLTRWLEHAGQVGPSFYNQVNLPLALLVALLLSVVPFLTWRGTPAREVMRRMRWPGAVAVTVAALAFALDVRDPLHLLLVLLATAALGANLVKTFEVASTQGLGGAGGWLAHVGVGIMLIGFLASSAYDESVKVTLAQGEPRQVDDLTLTFTRYIPRQGREKERMEVRVVREDGSELWAYPKLFVNDRTRQVMANPDVHSSPLQDLYISPIEIEPGRREGEPERVLLAAGERATVGGLDVRFAGFRVPEQHEMMVALADGGTIEIGAHLEIAADGAAATSLVPTYAFTAAGAVTAPPAELPGGGMVMVSSIDAAEGRVQLDLWGVPGLVAEPARLSLDVTRKPLIKLVWYGLYVVLFGGLLSTVKRLRQGRRVDELGEAVEAAKAGRARAAADEVAVAPASAREELGAAG
ncbi:MAG TPA: cytochrome c biogenesis protein CcsA [Thermoanaerobaculia bacterium]|nr:cytochrome c biogenesis protein CcsA [Thermoanaerobaculia bacterium]